MYTVLIRDEQGNMKVVHDWHTGSKPYLMSPQACQEYVSKLRAKYPYASKGLEFAYYYTGDDWSAMRPTRQTKEFDDLPDFRHMLKTNAPDWVAPRENLERTAAPARTEQSVRQSDGKRLYVCKNCGWKGEYQQVETTDSDSLLYLGWICPDCKQEQTTFYETQPPILIEPK